MRKLAREVARNQSYKRSGTTDMFHYFSDKIWREKMASCITQDEPYQEKAFWRKKVMEENKIYQNDNPKNGPLDGVQLRTDCVRTKFTQKRQKTGYPFKQSQTKANVSASVETGTFSIRDVQTNIMLAIRLEDAMAVCAAAADASRKAEGCTETKEDAGVAEPKSGL